MKNIALSLSLEEFTENIQLKHPCLNESRVDGCNSYGFRFDEPQDDVDVCYYGCSFTFGAEIESDDCWTNVIDNALNLKSNNFGIRGASIDDVACVFIATSKFVKMKKAIFLLPSLARQTIAYTNNNLDVKYISVIPAQHTYSTLIRTQIADTWLRLPNEYYQDRILTAIGTIEYIAKLIGIKTYWSSYDAEVFDMIPFTKTANYFVNDWKGSDKQHPGPEAHYNFAQQIIKIL